MALATHPSKTRLLDATLQVIRARGYSATTVDDIYPGAGVSNGSVFHHFKGKEDLAVTSANYWSEITSAFFAAPPYHGHAAALDRVLGYIDFRKSILQGAFILAKAQGSAQVAADSVDHLCRYVELLFGVRRSPARM